MHALKTSFSKEIGGSNRFKSRQNACFRYIAFIYFFAVPNRLKYHHNACFRDVVFIYFFLQLQIVSKTVKMHHLPSLFSFFFRCSSKSFEMPSQFNACSRYIVFIFSLQFQIVSKPVRIHHLPSMFSFFLCSSKSFEMPSQCML